MLINLLFILHLSLTVTVYELPLNDLKITVARVFDVFFVALQLLADINYLFILLEPYHKLHLFLLCWLAVLYFWFVFGQNFAKRFITVYVWDAKKLFLLILNEKKFDWDIVNGVTKYRCICQTIAVLKAKRINPLFFCLHY